MAFPWAAIAVAASAGKAYAAYYEGMAKKAYYDAQADMKLLQYKDKRIESKEYSHSYSEDKFCFN